MMKIAPPPIMAISAMFSKIAPSGGRDCSNRLGGFIMVFSIWF
jgi:hypothetical protein